MAGGGLGNEFSLISDGMMGKGLIKDMASRCLAADRGQWRLEVGEEVCNIASCSVTTPHTLVP